MLIIFISLKSLNSFILSAERESRTGTVGIRRITERCRAEERVSSGRVGGK